jgi:threonine synthase
MQNEIYAVKITDAETKATIRSVYDDYQTLLEPHGSVGWTGLQKYLAGHGESPEQLCVTLETAHPAKFPETIREILGIEPERPKGLEGLEDKEESFVSMHNDFEAFKTFLTKTY